MRYTLTVLIFGTVFAASVLNQFPIRSWQVLVARFDRWTFLPFWAFFAPNPGYAGTHLVFRDRDSVSWTDWKEMKLPNSNGWRWLWNPGRYELKALQDFLNGLARTAAEVRDPIALELTSCHLGLLTWVMAQPHLSVNSKCRQFVLLQTTGHGPKRLLRPVFVSREFSLG